MHSLYIGYFGRIKKNPNRTKIAQKGGKIPGKRLHRSDMHSKQAVFKVKNKAVDVE